MKDTIFPYQQTLSMLMYLFHISEFAASEPVPGFNDGTLQLAFADLRQVGSST